ncbi:unnamed protein product [Arabis nemorensis]|uniref:D-lactate dehydrogenase (cytochrome) n=1 Tax=Arabis nemorensis TaxID=586526 RepID=A0A565CIX2_9BRAS|nr:unnamed protein product [Arabis nemorensis]
MAFSLWLTRSRLSSRTVSAFLRPTSRQLHSTAKATGESTVISPEKGRRRLPNWLTSSLLPLAIAASATSFALLNQSYPSISESSALDSRGITIGGKDSTEPVVKGEYKPVPKELIDELKTILEDNLTTDYDERFFHGKPQNSFHKSVNIPDVVVFPRSEEEVSKILKSCNEYKVPIVPYGGATSIEGHTLAPNGGVCIDMSSMKRVKALHVEDMDVVVEPGIGWLELNEYLEQYGLFFPLDPGPGATIGGMCATRCSGSLAVVLPNGDVVKTASRARKSAAGYDLTRLIIGSEGTLGVITEVTLRLQRIPQHSVVAICNFPTVKDAADVAIATMQTGIQVSRMELLDEVQIRALNMANGKNLTEAPTLMFEFIGTEAYALKLFSRLLLNTMDQTLCSRKNLKQKRNSGRVSNGGFLITSEADKSHSVFHFSSVSMVATFISEYNPLNRSIVSSFSPVPKSVLAANVCNGVNGFWDWDNGPLSQGYVFDDLRRNIEAGLKQYRNELYLETFTAVGNYYGLAKEEPYVDRIYVAGDRFGRLQEWCRTFDTPVRSTACERCNQEFPKIYPDDSHLINQDQFCRHTDVGDAMLAREMKYLQLLRDPPGYVLLISGDKDFTLPLMSLVQRGWQILVAEPNQIHRSKYRRFARAVWKWGQLSHGFEPFIRHTARQVDDSVRRFNMSTLWSIR